MDVGELRNAFLMGEALSDRVRDFRAERLARIESGDIPTPIRPGAKAVLHVSPVEAFGRDLRFPMPSPESLRTNLAAIADIPCDHERPNLDGYLRRAEDRQGGSRRCVQLFRNGCLEAVDTSSPLCRWKPQGQWGIGANLALWRPVWGPLGELGGTRSSALA